MPWYLKGIAICTSPVPRPPSLPPSSILQTLHARRRRGKPRGKTWRFFDNNGPEEATPPDSSHYLWLQGRELLLDDAAHSLSILSHFLFLQNLNAPELGNSGAHEDWGQDQTIHILCICSEKKVPASSLMGLAPVATLYL